jgi:hypothetical protein
MRDQYEKGRLSWGVFTACQLFLLKVNFDTCIHTLHSTHPMLVKMTVGWICHKSTKHNEQYKCRQRVHKEFAQGFQMHINTVHICNIYIKTL